MWSAKLCGRMKYVRWNCKDVTMMGMISDLVTLYQLRAPASVPASYREMVKIKFLLVLNQLGHPGTGW